MIKPKRLTRGDKAAVVSLSSGSLGEEKLIHKFDIAKNRFAQYGIELVAMPHALKGKKYVYEHPEQRAADLMQAFSDPEIKAVICAIGGDDTIRLLPYIDFDLIRNNPKIFTGYSDTTSNHFMMYKAGLVSYYGGNLMCDFGEYVEMNPYFKASFENMLLNPKPTLDIPCSDFYACECDRVHWGIENMNKKPTLHKNTGYEILQGSGKVKGELLGGCVELFMMISFTELWRAVDWRGKLLLLETSEDDLPPEYLLWMLRGMAADGMFDKINGIVMGKPDYEDKYEPYKEVIKKALYETGRSDLPVLYNVNVGHAYPIGILPLGLKYEIDCDNKRFTLLEQATE